MPARKPTNTSQFDLFAAASAPIPRAPVPSNPQPPPKPANDMAIRPPPRKPPPPTHQPPPATDEWWTTRMTCAFLKISRKTLWERRRDPSLKFPQPVQLGGTRNLYRASSVRHWAEKMAALTSAAEE
jgi:predicted DNA-binding transcriptional regulator AlpA